MQESSSVAVTIIHRDSPWGRINHLKTGNPIIGGKNAPVKLGKGKIQQCFRLRDTKVTTRFAQYQWMLGEDAKLLSLWFSGLN